MRSRHARASVVLVLTGWIVAPLLDAQPAGALSPARQGWWTTENVSGLPVDASSVTGTPSDGLLVQFGAGSPTAYAAVAYAVPAGSRPTTLTLTTATAAVSVPDTTLKLCALRSASFTAAQGGAIADAPAYDCSEMTTATLAPATTTFTFDVSTFAVTTTFAVAVLPGDTTSRAVLAKPDDASLATAPIPSVPTSPSLSYVAPHPATTPNTANPSAPGHSTMSTLPGLAQPVVNDAQLGVLPPDASVTTDPGSGAVDPAPIVAGDQPTTDPAANDSPAADGNPITVASATSSGSPDGAHGPTVVPFLLIAAILVGSTLWARASKGPRVLTARDDGGSW